MKVMLLAAGRSKRMAPIEDKNFINLLGKPLIQHQLEAIVASGLNEIIIVGGAHNLDKLKEISKNLGINADVVEQENLELGMCGAVLAAKKFIKGSPVLVVSSNDVVEKSAFELILKQSDEKLASSFMLAKTVKEYFSGGYLKVDKDNYISEIVEKPENGKEPSNLINIVLHIHKKKKNPYEGFWQPVKFPRHIHKVFNFLFDNAEKNVDGSASVADSAVIKGDVIIDENVKIFDGAVVNGPVYIGKNSIVANNALVRDSNVGESCVIGFSTEIARSCLGNNVWTHSNYIGDSVIGNNVSFGAGTITGNLRLDEENIFVNCDDKEPLKKCPE
ncbi:NTP transferase domain-containing protein [Candidatus Peregrinibacteria bacterium]|nr:NTP transferase domain-containing protein [Candidatus Peregrinibacteria bacterium]